ncbi:MULTISPECIES: hypothetical protein [Parafrankia]|nr:MULTISPECIES: hypothetical protein [Parafrankia]MBE3201310.1 hypothetical protein [Parafrankia sp. CH37]
MGNAECALALAGGYVLGRTKKAKTAIGVGLWLSGRSYHAKDILRDQAVRLMRSTAGEQLINQIRGPALDAGRRAAAGAYEAQLDRLSGALAERTARLTETARESAEREAASGAPDRSHDGDRKSDVGDDGTVDQQDSDEAGRGFPERRVRGRSPGPRRDVRREPQGRAAQASARGGSR